MNNKVIDVSVSEQPSQSVDQDMQLVCDTESFLFNDVSIYYSSVSDPNNLFLYGTAKEGRLTGLVPKLDPETDYVISIIYADGEQFTLKGKEIDALIENYDTEAICKKAGR